MGVPVAKGLDHLVVAGYEKIKFLSPRFFPIITNYLGLVVHNISFMKLFKHHTDGYWVILIGSILISFFALDEIGIGPIIGFMGSLLGFAFVLTLIPTGVYYLIGKKLNPEQFMYTFLVAWLLMVVLMVLGAG